MLSEEILNTNPLEWNPLLKDEWIKFETSAFSHYTSKRTEGDDYFEDYYLEIKDPTVFRHRREETTKHYFFRNFNNTLVAYASYFLTDLHTTNDLWNNIQVNSVGIVARKMMAVPTRSLIDNGMMVNRKSLAKYLQFIKENYYQEPTQFALLAHFQPDSMRLLNKFIRNIEIGKVFMGLTRIIVNGRYLNPELIGIRTIPDKDELGGFALVKFKL